ncbi:MAG: UvrD-helicase domain-containing protein [Kiritimatiellia bacterium]
MNPNELIEASAGTGKTQALAERLIALVAAGVEPQEIVALTFSRAAAGEIFERFVTLLAQRVEEGKVGGELLRKVIETQHLSLIGTLDSFLMRIVRSFPLELGIGGALEMMDDYEAAVERARVSSGILRRTDAAIKRAFDEAFALAMNRESVRSFTETYRAFVAAWHERLLAQPDPRAWGDAAQVGLAASVGCPVADARALAACADALEGMVDAPAWAEFVAWVRDFRGSFAGVRGFAKKLLDLGEGLFAGATVEFSFSRRAYAFGGEQARAIRAAIAAVAGFVLRMKLETARGIYTLVSSFEAEYAKRVRSAGRLVFADVPRLISGLGDDARLALEYRMDARLRAWALDEFQDTSREQWKALAELLDAAKQSAGEKSVFVVGDRKQAIYGWRNGDVGIFTAERESGAYALRELRKSWRYGPPIVEAVNAVFVHGRLKDEFPDWTSPEHQTARPELDGFVQAVESAGPGKEDFVEPVFNALKAVDPVARGLSAAVLVRTNAIGELLATGLKQRGLAGVVWEGESAVLDTPALLAFLDTLMLADHPGDRQAYEHFRRSPLARARYGEQVPTAAELSGEFALSFATKGVVRTFRDLRAALPEEPSVAWSAFTEDRFTDMLRAAAEFERTMGAGVRLGDFVAFLASRRKRNVAEPGQIRIMTIHRSKGLGFDYVVLPLYEHDALDAAADGPLVGPDWILPDPGARVAQLVPALREASRARQNRVEQEALCTYYVAMTRAKRAMTIVLHPAAKTTRSLRFSEFVREAIPAPIGNPAWYEGMAAHPAARADDAPHSPPPHSLPSRPPRRRLVRRLPSLPFGSGESAGNLFAAAGARQAALARGTAAHAAYERIAWIAAADAKTDLERALVRPEGPVTLWREQPFEVRSDGTWTSGRFDRVVITGTGALRRAVVYDFKTNAKSVRESEAEFAARMVEAYRGQMAAYRRALVALTGIPAANVTAVLLLEATAAAVSV